MDVTDYPNWFDGYARQAFERWLLNLAGKPDLKFLQIGVFTGDATVWLAENILTSPTSTLIDVDTWKGSPDESVHQAFNWDDVRKTYANKKSKYENVYVAEGSSATFFARVNQSTYDFIYIDGDHTAQAVYADAVNSWKVLKPNGILAFDDYTWGDGLPDQRFAPKPGINKFLDEMMGEYELLEQGAQVWIRKKQGESNA